MRIPTRLLVLARHTMQGEGDGDAMKLGKLIRVIGTSKVYCTGQSHIKLNHTGSWLVVDRYLKTNHMDCAPLQYQNMLEGAQAL